MKRNITRHLINWKKKTNRKPLIVRGARQVGKTHSVIQFGQDNYKNTAYLNLDNTKQKDLFSNIESVDDFINIASTFTKTKISPENTLIFIDEIQNLPNLVHLLRFFYEENPEYHVIAAGSLFENYLASEKISMPVGRVEYLYMYPLDFFEFLQAVSADNLLNTLQNVSKEGEITKSIHELSLSYFYEYTMIGGMPEIVAEYSSMTNFETNKEDLERIFDSLFESYLDDVDKYASLNKRNYIKYVFKQAPLFAGLSYNYTNFGGGTYSSVEISHAFRQLESSMLITEMLATNSNEIPLIGHRKKAKKLVFLDIGLVNYKSFGELINIDTLKGINKNNQLLADNYSGRIIEQFVGQSLLTLHQHKKNNLLYWARDKENAQAEIDFSFIHQGKICGVEVKSGSTGNLKSLYSFAENVRNNSLIRVYTGELRKEDVFYHDKRYRFYSLPVYLMPRILDFV